jgi:NAD(P)-dependent dehydrogenase (short-subunit alcohol dehydrogenase family)
MPKLCEGRVVIVTGAARGVGREHAKLLAANGAQVIVNDLGTGLDGAGVNSSLAGEVADEIRASGGIAFANGSDVSDWNGAKGLIDQALQQFGRLDALVNNAGMLRDRMLVNMTEEEWDLVIKVNMKGTFAPSRHAAAYWKELAKSTGMPVNARIINTTSASGIYGNFGQCNYGAAKAGVAAFTGIAAKELARIGVTVNAVAPRAHTRMTAGLKTWTQAEIDESDPKWVSALVTWLVSADSTGVTGRVFEAGMGILAIAEGWHQGPCEAQIGDPEAVGGVVRGMLSRARPEAQVDGRESNQA